MNITHEYLKEKIIDLKMYELNNGSSYIIY